jgi:hypothetical protein
LASATDLALSTIGRLFISNPHCGLMPPEHET